MATSNQSLRQQKRLQRRQLPARVQQQHARAIARILNRQPAIRNAARIGCYLANDGEIATDYLIESAWRRGQQIYLPVLSPLKNSLFFAPYRPDSDMACNRFGIAEPACHAGHWLRARQLDVILLPLVAFDEHGNRLGMGGGFYDRTLAFLKHRLHRRKPLLIGLAHECQASDAIISHSWDVPLDAIATEERFLRF